MAHPAEDFRGCRPHLRVHMHGIDDFYVLEIFRDLTDGFKDIMHVFAQILPPVTGHGDDPLVFKIDVFQCLILKFIRTVRHFQQSIDYRISGNDDFLRIDPFPDQIVRIPLSRSEMNRGQMTGEHRLTSSGKGEYIS